MNEPIEIIIPVRNEQDLAAAIRDHIAHCDKDHRSNFHQVPLVVFNWQLSTFTCNRCFASEYLNKPPVDGGSIDTYVHHMLKQQQAFFDTHFASCVTAEANA